MEKPPTTASAIHISERSIGEIVAADYRTSTVFEKHGIDFCCGGNVPLAEICMTKGLDVTSIVAELDSVQSEPVERGQDYGSWEMSFLVDYIINVHHRYLKDNSGQIASYIHKIVSVHGKNYPELSEIASIFDKIVIDMTAHLLEEEEVLFPAIKQVDVSLKVGATAEAQDIKTITKSLKKLGREHEEIGDAIHAIRHLAKGYEIPHDACNTFVVTYQKLKEFEDDLHKHVHLENNILFLKARQL